MKNLHLLPTEKPSRLGYLTKKGKEVYKDLRLFEKPMPIILDSENLHIYITSDEEIKEGDWVYRDSGIVFKMTQELLEYYESIKDKDTHKRYKIILTTDPDLIADGVQAIDDDFLEWFVKNPSCESVEVKKGFEDGTAWGYNFLDYKIIIPQEEPKQETVEEADERMFNEKDMKQFAWQCVGNFLSNRDNEVEEKLVEVIIDRNNLEFEKFKKK
jgi:hypothetical protein